MSLSICLASPTPDFYSPGDVVCGTVSLDAGSDATIESVAITFSGYSDVALGPEPSQIAPKTTARRSGYLLFRQQQLLQGAHWCEKGISAWPFQFVLPKYGRLEMSTVEAAEPVCQSPWRSLHDVEASFLPPSMRSTSAFACSIEYVLVARLLRPPQAHLFGGQDLTARRTVRVRPGRLSDFPYACMSKTDMSVFQHELPARACPSIAKKLFSSRKGSDPGSLDSSSSDEVVLFCVRVPSILNVRNLASNKFAIFAISNSTVATRQEIRVNRYRVELAIHTRARTETAKQSEVGVIVLAEGSMTTQIRQDCHISVCPQNITRPILAEHTIAEGDLTAIPLSVPHKQICDLPPEFASVNIFRAFTLNYLFQLQHGSVKVSVEGRAIPTSVADGTLKTAHPLQVPPDTFDVPPSYEGDLD